MKDELASRRDALPSARLAVQMFDQVLRPQRERIIDLMAATQRLMQLERRRPIAWTEVLAAFAAAMDIDKGAIEARVAAMNREEA